MRNLQKVIKMMDKVYEIRDCAETDIRHGYIKSVDVLDEYLNEAMDTACIYYSDCYEILRQSNVTDFSDYINCYGASTITDFAYYCLREAVDESGIAEELADIIERDYTCEECGEHVDECCCEDDEEEEEEEEEE